MLWLQFGQQPLNEAILKSSEQCVSSFGKSWFDVMLIRLYYNYVRVLSPKLNALYN